MLKFKALMICIVTVCTFSISAQETMSISQEQLISLMAAPKSEAFIVLDVRSEKEFNQGHIKGAINISHQQIEDRVNSLEKYKNVTVVVHCRSGRRAGIAEAILAKSGFTRLRHLTGDMNGWVDSNLPVVTK